MAIVQNLTQVWADGDQVTSTKLNNIVTGLTFKTGAGEAVDGTTLLVDAGGYLKVGTIQTGNIAAGAVSNAQIATASVANAANSVVLRDSSGNFSAGVITASLIGDVAGTATTATTVSNQAITGAKLSGNQPGSAPVYGVRAWRIFDATRNAAGGSDSANTARYLYATGGNITSVTKTGTGAFTVVMTTALPDANYAVVGNAGGSGSPRLLGSNISTQTTTTFYLTTCNEAGVATDYAYNSFIVIR